MSFESIVYCEHYVNDRQVPCPPMCPTGTWPPYLFRRTLFRGRWKVRRGAKPLRKDPAAT